MNFSVLMSLYDREVAENLKRSLSSLRSQTLVPSEIVLVYDGPIRQELRQVVEDFSEKFENLKVIPQSKNLGLGQALNNGLDHCTHEIIARMDTDDICYPDRFEKQIAYLEKNADVSVLGAGIQEFETEPGDLNRFRKLPTSTEEIKRFAHFRNPLNHPTVIFVKSHVLAAGSYQDMPLFEDYYLWIRLIQKGYRIANLSEPLLHFRIGNDMIGRRHGVGYFKKELKFLRAAKALEFINTTQFLASVTLKLPLRLFPKKFLELFYKSLLR